MRGFSHRLIQKNPCEVELGTTDTLLLQSKSVSDKASGVEAMSQPDKESDYDHIREGITESFNNIYDRLAGETGKDPEDFQGNDQ